MKTFTRYTAPGLLILCAAGLANSQEKGAARPRITTAQIRNAEIIGSLGVPLGECVQIEAVVTKGGRTKAQAGRYLLTVTHVAGNELVEPEKCFFYVHRFATARVRLANDAFGLHELQTGNKAGQIDSVEITELEQGYVGSRVSLLAYETGAFDGIPNNLPKNVALWAGHRYHLMTYLAVMDQTVEP